MHSRPGQQDAPDGQADQRPASNVMRVPGVGEGECDRDQAGETRTEETRFCRRVRVVLAVRRGCGGRRVQPGDLRPHPVEHDDCGYVPGNQQADGPRRPGQQGDSQSGGTRSRSGGNPARRKPDAHRASSLGLTAIDIRLFD